MTADLLVPGVVAIALAAALGVVRLPMPPRFSLKVLTVAAVLSALLAVLVVGATVVAFAVGPARTSQLIEWCRLIPVHHRVGPVVGAVAVVALTAMAVRVQRVFSHRRWALALGGEERIRIIETDRPLAYAVPRGQGCIVVSTGMLDVLEPRERSVLFAHERAHLNQRHHRYLLAGELAKAVLPLLGPLVSQLRHATERCADEEAVSRMQGDRRVVATAIARAALHMSSSGPLLPAFGGGSVPSRVQALVGHGPSRSVRFAGAGGAGALAACVMVALSLQVHHLALLADHICHG